MILRIARHTENLETIREFYCDILGFELLGKFEDHDDYDGIFIGKPDLGWHFEFTASSEKPNHFPDADDATVLYPQTQSEYDALISNIHSHGLQLHRAKNPYWNQNGTTISDPDGYLVIISPLRINP